MSSKGVLFCRDDAHAMGLSLFENLHILAEPFLPTPLLLLLGGRFAGRRGGAL
jgi:hypothetical protein